MFKVSIAGVAELTDEVTKVEIETLHYEDNIDAFTEEAPLSHIETLGREFDDSDSAEEVPLSHIEAIGLDTANNTYIYEAAMLEIENTGHRNNNDSFAKSRKTKTTITVTGRISFDAGKSSVLNTTKAIADWSRQKPEGDCVYKTISIEYARAGLSNEYEFTNVFVISYHEQFCEEDGYFEIVMRPVRLVDESVSAASEQMVEGVDIGTSDEITVKTAPRKRKLLLTGSELDSDWIPEDYGYLEGTLSAKPVKNRVNIEGSVKVAGKSRNVGREVYQIEIDKNYTPVSKAACGLTNQQLMAKGKAPYIPIYDENGKVIGETMVELHHLDHPEPEPGTMLEISTVNHDKDTKILHGMITDSFRNDEEEVLEKQFNNFRRNYWKWRANNC